jgi:uncharacterized protein YcbK (DUF882 family)
VTGFFLFGASNALQTATAEGDTRTISFHHLHTGEDITITYKRDGRYDEAALKQLDWFMRDWRHEQSTHMDPHLFDVLWETNREVGGTQPIQVVCGFRSPETNSMLRARSSGVAQNSQHTHGNAMDFFMPAVPLEKIRNVGLRLQRGGVGFYPTSGSPFVHLDTGNIRHWPRMTHDQLVKVFPDGRTVHVPSDGHPLPGYAQALAEVESRGATPSTTSLAAARGAGIITASVEREAQSAAAKPKRSLFAGLFGAPKDDEEPGEVLTPVRASASTAVASLTPPPARPRSVPMPPARPRAVAMAAAKPKPAAQPIVTAALATDNVFDMRGYWRGAIDAGHDPAPPARVKLPFEIASADSDVSGLSAMAYASDADTAKPAQTAQALSAKVRPMGSTMPRLPETASLSLASSSTSPLTEPPLAAARSQGAGSLASPWLRAAMLTPSVNHCMTATTLTAADPRPLHELMHKPVQALAMTFSADPYLGVETDRFSGRAVVFLATANFTTQTASLK